MADKQNDAVVRTGANYSDTVLLETKVIKKNRNFLANLLVEMYPSSKVYMIGIRTPEARDSKLYQGISNAKIFFPQYVEFAYLSINNLHVLDKHYASEAYKLKAYLVGNRNVFCYSVEEPFRGATYEEFVEFINTKAHRSPALVLDFDDVSGFLDVYNHIQQFFEGSKEEEMHARYFGRSLDGLDDVSCFQGAKFGFSSSYSVNRMSTFVPGFYTIEYFLQRLFECYMQEKTIQKRFRIQQLTEWIYAYVQLVDGFSRGLLRASYVKNLTLLSLIRQLRLCPILETAHGYDILFSYKATPEQNYYEDLIFTKYRDDIAVNRAVLLPAVYTVLDVLLTEAYYEYLRVYVRYSLEFLTKAANQDFLAFISRYDMDSTLFDLTAECEHTRLSKVFYKRLSDQSYVYSAVFPVQASFGAVLEHLEAFHAARSIFGQKFIFAHAKLGRGAQQMLRTMRDVALDDITLCDRDLLSPDPEKTLQVLIWQNMTAKQMNSCVRYFSGLFSNDDELQKHIVELKATYSTELHNEGSIKAYIQSARDLAPYFAEDRYTIACGWEASTLLDICSQFVKLAIEVVQYYFGYRLFALGGAVESTSPFFDRFCTLFGLIYRDQVYELVHKAYDELHELLFTQRRYPTLQYDFYQAGAQLEQIMCAIDYQAIWPSNDDDSAAKSENYTPEEWASPSCIVQTLLTYFGVHGCIIDIPQRLSKYTRLFKVRLAVELRAEGNDTNCIQIMSSTAVEDLLYLNTASLNVFDPNVEVILSPSIKDFTDYFYQLLDEIDRVPEQVFDLQDLLKGKEKPRTLPAPDFAGYHAFLRRDRQLVEEYLNYQLAQVYSVADLFVPFVEHVFDPLVDYLVVRYATLVNNADDLPGFGAYIQAADSVVDQYFKIMLGQYLMSREEAAKTDGEPLRARLGTITRNHLSFILKADPFIAQRQAVEAVENAKAGFKMAQCVTTRYNIELALFGVYVRFRMYAYLLYTALAPEIIYVDLFAIDITPFKIALEKRVLGVLYAVEATIAARAFCIMEFSGKLARYAHCITECTPTNPYDWCYQRKFVMDGFDFAFRTSIELLSEVEAYDQRFFVYFGAPYGYNLYDLDELTGRKYRSAYSKIFNKLITLRVNYAIVCDYSNMYRFLYAKKQFFGYNIRSKYSALSATVLDDLRKSRDSLLEYMNQDRDALCVRQTKLMSAIEDFVKKTPRSEMYFSDHTKFAYLAEQQRHAAEDIRDQITALSKECEKFIVNEHYMDLPESDFSTMDAILPVFACFVDFWGLHCEQESYYPAIMRSTFLDNYRLFDGYDKLKTYLDERARYFDDNASRMRLLAHGESEANAKSYGTTFMQAYLINYAAIGDLRWFLANFEVFIALCYPQIRKRHTVILASSGLVFEASVVSMNKLLERNVFSSRGSADCGGVSAELTYRAKCILKASQLAQREYEIEERLAQIDYTWQVATLKFDGQRIYVAGLPYLRRELETDIYKLRVLLQSQYAEYFAKKISLTIEKLTAIREILVVVTKVYEKYEFLLDIQAGLQLPTEIKDQLDFLQKTYVQAYQMLVSYGTLSSIFSMAGNFYLQDHSTAQMLRTGAIAFKNTNTNIITTQLFVQMDAHTDWLCKAVYSALDQLQQATPLLQQLDVKEIMQLFAQQHLKDYTEAAQNKYKYAFCKILHADDVYLSVQRLEYDSSDRYEISLCSVTLHKLCFTFDSITVCPEFFASLNLFEHKLQQMFVTALEYRANKFLELPRTLYLVALNLRFSKALECYFAYYNVDTLCNELAAIYVDCVASGLIRQITQIMHVMQQIFALNKADPYFCNSVYAVAAQCNLIWIENGRLLAGYRLFSTRVYEVSYYRIGFFETPARVSNGLLQLAAALQIRIAYECVIWGAGYAFARTAYILAAQLGRQLLFVIPSQFSDTNALVYFLRRYTSGNWVFLLSDSHGLSSAQQDAITAFAAAGASSNETFARVFVQLEESTRNTQLCIYDYEAADIQDIVFYALYDANICLPHRYAELLANLLYLIGTDSPKGLTCDFLLDYLEFSLRNNNYKPSNVFLAEFCCLLRYISSESLNLIDYLMQQTDSKPEMTDFILDKTLNAGKKPLYKHLTQGLAGLNDAFSKFYTISLGDDLSIMQYVHLYAKATNRKLIEIYGVCLDAEQMWGHYDADGIWRCGVLYEKLREVDENAILVVSGVNYRLLQHRVGLFTFSNGETIKLPDSVRILFVQTCTDVFVARPLISTSLMSSLLQAMEFNGVLLSRILALASEITKLTQFEARNAEPAMINFLLVILALQDQDKSYTRDEADLLIYYAIFVGIGQFQHYAHHRRYFCDFVKYVFCIRTQQQNGGDIARDASETAETTHYTKFLGSNAKLLDSCDGFEMVYYNDAVCQQKRFLDEITDEKLKAFLQCSPLDAQTSFAVFKMRQRGIALSAIGNSCVIKFLASALKQTYENAYVYSFYIRQSKDLLKALTAHYFEYFDNYLIAEPETHPTVICEFSAFEKCETALWELYNSQLCMHNGVYKHFDKPQLFLCFAEQPRRVCAFYLAFDDLALYKVAHWHAAKHELSKPKFISFLEEFCAYLDFENYEKRNTLILKALEDTFESIDLLVGNEKGSKLYFYCNLFVDMLKKEAYYYGIELPANLDLIFAELRKAHNFITTSYVFNFCAVSMTQKQVEEMHYYIYNQYYSPYYAQKLKELLVCRANKLYLQQNDEQAFESMLPRFEECIYYPEFVYIEMRVIFKLARQSLVIRGPPGIGKHLVAYCAAAYLKFEIQELKASFEEELRKAFKQALSKPVVFVVNRALTPTDCFIVHGIVYENDLDHAISREFVVQHTQLIREQYTLFMYRSSITDYTEAIPRTYNYLREYCMQLLRTNFRLLVCDNDSIKIDCNVVDMVTPYREFLIEKFKINYHLHLQTIVGALYDVHNVAMTQGYYYGCFSLGQKYMEFFYNLLYLFDRQFITMQANLSSAAKYSYNEIESKIAQSQYFCRYCLDSLSADAPKSDQSADYLICEFRAKQQQYEQELQKQHIVKEHMQVLNRQADQLHLYLYNQYKKEIDTLIDLARRATQETQYPMHSKLPKDGTVQGKMVQGFYLLFNESFPDLEPDAVFAALLSSSDLAARLEYYNVFALSSETCEYLINLVGADTKADSQRGDAAKFYGLYLQSMADLAKDIIKNDAHTHYLHAMQEKSDIQAEMKTVYITCESLYRNVVELKDAMYYQKTAQQKREGLFKTYNGILDRLVEIDAMLKARRNCDNYTFTYETLYGDALLLASVFNYTAEHNLERCTAFLKQITAIEDAHGIQHSDVPDITAFLQLAQYNHSWLALNSFPSETQMQVKMAQMQAILRDLRHVPCLVDSAGLLEGCLPRYGVTDKPNYCVSSNAIRSIDTLKQLVSSAPILIIKLDQDANTRELASWLYETYGEVILYSTFEMEANSEMYADLSAGCYFLRLATNISVSLVREKLMRLISEDRFLLFKKLYADSLAHYNKSYDMWQDVGVSIEYFIGFDLSYDNVDSFAAVLEQLKRSLINATNVTNYCKTSVKYVSDMLENATLQRILHLVCTYTEYAVELGKNGAYYVNYILETHSGFWEQYEYESSVQYVEQLLYNLLCCYLRKREICALQLRMLCQQNAEFIYQISQGDFDTSGIQVEYGQEFQQTYQALYAGNEITAARAADLAAFCAWYLRKCPYHLFSAVNYMFSNKLGLYMYSVAGLLKEIATLKRHACIYAHDALAVCCVADTLGIRIIKRYYAEELLVSATQPIKDQITLLSSGSLAVYKQIRAKNSLTSLLFITDNFENTTEIPCLHIYSDPSLADVMRHLTPQLTVCDVENAEVRYFMYQLWNIGIIVAKSQCATTTIESFWKFCQVAKTSHICCYRLLKDSEEWLLVWKQEVARRIDYVLRTLIRNQTTAYHTRLLAKELLDSQQKKLLFDLKIDYSKPLDEYDIRHAIEQRTEFLNNRYTWYNTTEDPALDFFYVEMPYYHSRIAKVFAAYRLRIETLSLDLSYKVAENGVKALKVELKDFYYVATPVCLQPCSESSLHFRPLYAPLQSRFFAIARVASGAAHEYFVLE